MTWPELAERLADLIQEQAAIIKDQALALAQFEAVSGLDERIAEAERKKYDLLGE